MKRIEAVVRRAELNHFFQCAESLGIFGFDLCECRDSRPSCCGAGRRVPLTNDASRLKVDFAVRDSDTTDTVHAVLEQVHPDSIAIFTLDHDHSQLPGEAISSETVHIV